MWEIVGIGYLKLRIKTVILSRLTLSNAEDKPRIKKKDCFPVSYFLSSFSLAGSGFLILLSCFPFAGYVLLPYEAEKCGSVFTFFMSTLMVFCQNLVFSKNSSSENSFSSRYVSCVVVRFSCGRKKSRGLVPNAKKRQAKKRSWWQRFFFDEDGNWFGLKDEEMVDFVESDGGSSDDELSENEKFEAWKRRAEAIVELREAQQEVKNEENRRWEDWLVDGSNNDDGNASSWAENSDGVVGNPRTDVDGEFSELFSRGGLVKSVRDSVLGREDDDILYEDRVFRYASLNSAKFLAVLIIIPWALDFLVHDYVLMPFLDRYVKTVPLAAQMLDVRKSQKLEMVKTLNLEKAQYRLEVEIGKSPLLSDEELYLELRHKALELRNEWRLENRKAFANIWSDMVFGVSLFMLLYFNQSQVDWTDFGSITTDPGGVIDRKSSGF